MVYRCSVTIGGGGRFPKHAVLYNIWMTRHVVGCGVFVDDLSLVFTVRTADLKPPPDLHYTPPRSFHFSYCAEWLVTVLTDMYNLK